MTLPTNQQLEAMLANVPPKPWTVAFRSDGSAYCSFGDPMAGSHLQINIGLDWDGYFDKHIATLIALAPTLATQRIADAKRIAELEAAMTEARRAIGSHAAPDARLVPVEQLDRWMGYTSQHGGAANCLKEIRAIIRGQP